MLAGPFGKITCRVHIIWLTRQYYIILLFILLQIYRFTTTTTTSASQYYIILATRQTDVSTSVIQIPATPPPSPTPIFSNRREMRGFVIV